MPPLVDEICCSSILLLYAVIIIITPYKKDDRTQLLQSGQQSLKSKVGFVLIACITLLWQTTVLQHGTSRMTEYKLQLQVRAPDFYTQ